MGTEAIAQPSGTRARAISSVDLGQAWYWIRTLYFYYSVQLLLWQLSQGATFVFFFFFLFFQIIFGDNKKLVPVTIIKQSKFVYFFFKFIYSSPLQE